MKNNLLLATAAMLALAVPAAAQMAPGGAGSKAGAEQAQATKSDQDFAKKAAIGGMFEVESSELANDKAQSAEVKKFAAQMIRDHGKANNELKSAAQDLNIPLPDELDSKHRQALQKLESAQEGAAFDRAYIDAQREAHREAVALFSRHSKANGALSAWAQKTLPVLQQHQRHIQQIGGVASKQQDSSTGRSAAEPAAR